MFNLGLLKISFLSMCLVTQLCLTYCNPMDCSPPDSSVHGDSPGKNTGVGCHALFQGTFPTQELNQGLLLCRFFPGELPGTPFISVISSVAQSCPTLYEPMDCGTPDFPIYHQLPELAQTHVHWVSDAIQPSHPLLPPSPPAFNLSQHQGLFQWVSSSHQMSTVLEFQHQSSQWIFRVDFL